MLILIGDFEQPAHQIDFDDGLLLELKGHIEYKILPENLLLISNLDVFKITELNIEEIRSIAAALNTIDILDGIDEELSIVLLHLKTAFNDAIKNNFSVYGVGD